MVVIVLFVLQLTFSNSVFAIEAPSDTVKVKLSINNATTVPVYLDGNYSISEDTSISLSRQLYSIKIENNALNLYYGDVCLYTGATLTLIQHAPTEDLNNFVWLNNDEHGYRRYIGDLHFDISANCIRVINHVYLEDYLYGVVPYEMSDAWPAEALKAQAIAARTYVARCLGAGDYNVVDTSANQVYKGYDETKANTIEAIDATSKIVLMYNTNYANTYYSASNGGYTEIPYHVWGGGEDMSFVIKEDPYDVANPSSPYEEIFFPVAIDTDHPITASDNVEGTPNIDNAVRYIKTQILDSGQLTEAGYTPTSVDDFELTGVLSLTPHTLDTDDNDPHTEDHTRIPPSGENNCVDFVKATGDFCVSASKLVEGESVASDVVINGIELDLRYFDAANGDSTYKVFNFSSLRLFVVEAAMEGETLLGYSIYHRRYGHGIGMSQRGAQQRAIDGQTYDAILAFYYPETSIDSLNINKPTLTTIPESADNSNARVDCSSYLNVRSGAGTGYSILGALPKNARIEVTQSYTTPDWHRINYGSSDAYVHKDYIDLDTIVGVTGISLDCTELSLEIGDSQTLTVTITPDNASNQNVIWDSKNKSVATVSSTGVIQGISAGSATITATSVDGAFMACCDVTVNETQITSNVYTIDRDNQILLGVADGTTVSELKANLDNTAEAIVIVDAEGEAYTGELVGTGLHVRLKVDGTVQDELEICVLGDVSGDGVIDIIDYTYIRLDIFGLRELTSAFALAGDVSKDSIIDILDYTYVRLDIFDLRSIN